MEAPFTSLIDTAYIWIGAALGVAICTGKIQTSIAEKHLGTPVTQRPIIDFQMAGAKKRHDAIMLSWGQEGKHKAAVTLAWDYPFLASYGFGLALTCAVGAEAFRGFGWECAAAIAVIAGWAALVAAGLDAVENALLYWCLKRVVVSDRVPEFIRWVAMTKFLSLKIAFPVALVSIGFDVLGCRFGCIR